MRLLLIAMALSSFASAQVALQVTVQNAANGRVPGVVAPGSLAIISATVNGSVVPLPKTLTVEIGGEQAPVIAAPGYSVTVEVSSDVPTGTAVVEIGENGAEGSATVDVVASDFGLFTNSQGAGQALAQNVASGAVETNNLTHPAHPGDTVTLYGTGLGSATQVAVLLGGHPALVSYAGPAPSLPGVDQINFQVTDDPAIPDGCFVAVEVVVNGVATNQASLSKAAPGASACTPPIDLTGAQMAQLDAGQGVALVSYLIDGLVSAPPSAMGLVRNESFNVQTIQTNEAGLALLSQPLLADDVFYSCSTSGSALGAIALSGLGSAVDLGPQLTLTGPGTTGYLLTTLSGFESLSLPTGPAVSSPGQLPPPYFVPGAWTISGPGSPTTMPFSATITTPPTIALTDYASMTSNAIAQGFVATWNPAGYGPNDVITITVGPPAVTCRAHATDGQLALPPVTLPLETTYAILTTPPYLQISLAPRPDQIPRADIPLAAGGLVPGTFSYSFTESLPIGPFLALQ